MNARVAVLALVVAALATPSLAQSPPRSFKGQWHLDPTHSYAQPGPVPTDLILTITTDDGHVFDEQETWTGPDGKVRNAILHALVDGKFYPTIGLSEDLKVAITRWAPGSTRAEMAGADVHGVQMCDLSSDANTITFETFLTNSQQKNGLARSVYRRVHSPTP